MDKLGTAWFKDEKNISQAEEELQKITKSKDDKEVRAVVDFLCACLDCSTSRHLDAFTRTLGDKLIKWKGHDKEVCEILEKFQVLKENTKADDTGYDQKVATAVQKLLERTKTCHTKIRPSVVSLLVFALTKGTETHLYLAKGITGVGFSDMLNKMKADELKAVTEAYFQMIKAETLNPKSTAAIDVTNELCGDLTEIAKIKENIQTLAEIINYCSEKELYDKDTPDQQTVYGAAIGTMMSKFIMKNMGNPKYLMLVTPGFIRLLGNEEVSQRMSLSIYISMFMQQGEVLAPHAEPLLDAFINSNANETVDVLPAVYKHNPEPFRKRLPEIVKKMDDIAPDRHYGFYHLFHEISTSHPQEIMPYADKLEEGFHGMSSMLYALQATKELCKYDTKRFLDKIDTFDKVYKSQPTMCHLICEILSIIGLYSEECAERIMAYFQKILTTCDVVYQYSILMFMKTVGGRYKSVLEKQRANIEALLKSPQQGVGGMVQSIIDYINDKSLKTLDQEIQAQQEKVGKLNLRVAKTEEKVEEMQATVADQRQQLGKVKKEVKQQKEKLTELKSRKSGGDRR